MQKASIVTWNINSIRARMDIFIEWLTNHKPDVVLLQETKCTDKDFPVIALNEIGYNCSYYGQKSYNGVAILSKQQIDVEAHQIECHDVSPQARYIEGVLTINSKVFRVASIYVPQGGGTVLQRGDKIEDTPRFQYKLKFLKMLQERMQEILQYDEYVIFGGDYNVAYKAIDLHNPEYAAGDVGFHPDEIALIKNIYNSGYQDLFRKFYPNKREYTWWDYRRGGFENNRGWRIDYLMVNDKLSKISLDCVIHKEIRGAIKPSDHVPVEAIINVE